MADKGLIVCVPLSLHPASLGPEYSVALCDCCHGKVWLGDKCRALAEKGTDKVCAICAIAAGELTKDTPLLRLDKLNASSADS